MRKHEKSESIESSKLSCQELLTIACVQFEPRFGDVDYNIGKSVELIERASNSGAQVIVLPELCSTGYVFRTRSEAFELAETIPGGPASKAWSDVARRLGVIIISGIAELDGNNIYNSAVIVTSSGVLGVYRKLHLWGDETLYFEPGNLGAPVFDTPYGRISVAICYDGWFPEIFRIAAMQGADLVCIPTNWVPISSQESNGIPISTILHQAAAHSNGLVIACADRVGVERGQRFVGHSLIIDHTGWPIVGPASGDREEVIIGTVDLGLARRSRNLNKYNNLLDDRRADVYSTFSEL
ncbi:hydratase [Marinobacter vinifirmus]|uniref:Hydratase n=1 Tax=Marinobacter vinifirmus TaxID=355591 RepID=A0A7Z1DRN1_9GAMM|nr:nitrilase family protein [Marinobacter vinifirmus]OZC34753.1 hydratase [Marinobacter vinifirmus]